MKREVGTMLVLTRKSQESIVVGGSLNTDPILMITVLDVNSGKVKLGFDADSAVHVHRLEVWQRICANGQPRDPTRGPEAPVSE
jgi:carbon storage regulator CsrA